MIKIVTTITMMAIFVGCGGGDDDSKKDNTEEILADSVTITIGSQALSPTQTKVLSLHNEKRRNYYTDSDLTYSIDLENAAQAYANVLATNGRFEHDPENGTEGYGENLYASSANKKLDIKESMYHWYNEEKDLYNYSDGSCQEKYYKDSNLKIPCGHYTQVIWQESREVGCATAQYKIGNMKNGYLYVCKYKKAGNIKNEKPYCIDYDNSDIYLNNTPSSLTIAGKIFQIKLRDEDRVTCALPVDEFNSAIEFSSDLKTAKIVNFQIFNNGEYPNTLEFNSISIDGKTIKMNGINKNIINEKYKNKNIYMNFIIIGETTDYYSVEIVWNGIDSALPEYSRNMKAKLYKE